MHNNYPQEHNITHDSSLGALMHQKGPGWWRFRQKTQPCQRCMYDDDQRPVARLTQRKTGEMLSPIEATNHLVSSVPGSVRPDQESGSHNQQTNELQRCPHSPSSDPPSKPSSLNILPRYLWSTCDLSSWPLSCPADRSTIVHQSPPCFNCFFFVYSKKTCHTSSCTSDWKCFWPFPKDWSALLPPSCNPGLQHYTSLCQMASIAFSSPSTVQATPRVT